MPIKQLLPLVLSEPVEQPPGGTLQQFEVEQQLAVCEQVPMV